VKVHQIGGPLLTADNFNATPQFSLSTTSLSSSGNKNYFTAKYISPFTKTVDILINLELRTYPKNNAVTLTKDNSNNNNNNNMPSLNN
jgi:hypothetical protein